MELTKGHNLKDKNINPNLIENSDILNNGSQSGDDRFQYVLSENVNDNI